MLCFVSKRLTVLATPKTASTSIEAALLPHADVIIRGPTTMKHMRYQTYRMTMETMLRRRAGGHLTTCALMREPVSWLGSWYRYRQRDRLCGSPSSTREISFDEFVAGYLQDPQPAHARIGRQSRFLTDARNGRRVDRIWRYDDIADFVAFLEERLSLTLVLPQLNLSRAGVGVGVGQPELSSGMRQQLRDALAEDFALYESLARQPS